MTEPAEPRPQPSAATDARRGVLSVGGAKLLFVLLGLVTTWAVPRLLGTPESYGRFTTVMTALAILTNTLTTASVQTTSKLVSEAGADVSALVRRAWRFALGVGGAAALGFAALAPILSSFVFADASLTTLLLVAAVVPFAVTTYATGMGALNGGRRFGEQARLDAGFSLGRTLGQVGGAALGLGAVGAIGGYAAAACGLAVAAAMLVGVGRGEAGAKQARFLPLFVPIAACTLAQNGVLQLDVELLKAVHAAVLRDAGRTAADAAALASTEVGIYRAAQALAFVPYQLSIALTMVVFPLVSRATSTDDRESARRTVTDALRFAVLWLALCEAPLAGAGGRAIDLIFPASFAVGGDALPLLCLSQTLFALFALVCTVLTGAGRPWHAAGAALAGLCVVVLGAGVGIALVGPDGSVRVAAALGATSGAAVGLAVAMLLVHQLLGAVIPWGTIARAVLAGAAALGVARAIPLSGSLGALAALAAGASVYLGVLALTGELRALRPRRT